MLIFPEKGMSEAIVRKHLEIFRRKIDSSRSFFDNFLKLFAFKLLNKIRSPKITYPETAFCSYSTSPHPLAIEAISKFLPYNKNNIGTHTRAKKRFGLASLERKVILMIGDLMGAQNLDIDGYITQGGTEGNIMGLWVGRNLLRGGPALTHMNTKLCLLKTALTHYSVDKAADILDIKKIVNIALNDRYEMDSVELSQQIESLHKEGFSHFLIALTLGYNTTGTIDPVDEIDSVLKHLEKKHSIKTYVHLDAAIGGFVYPFISDKPFDFRYESVQSISLDMHKTGFLPNTAGIFLCRKNLQKWIERGVPYLKSQKDDSLSGSRSGATAAAAWSVISALGKDGLKKIILKELELKEYFLSSLKEKQIAVDYIENHFIPIIAFTLKEKKLPVVIAQKYGFTAMPLPLNGYSNKSFYTLVFMPHVTKNALNALLLDLEDIKC